MADDRFAETFDLCWFRQYHLDNDTRSRYHLDNGTRSGYHLNFRYVINDTPRIYNAKPDKVRSLNGPPPDVSLKKVLSEKPAHGPVFRMSRRDKADMILSLAVALYEIPKNAWIHEEWKADHIFFQSTTDMSNHPNLAFDKPFISTRLPQTSDAERDDSFDSDNYILSFALLLMEIQRGRRVPMQSLPESEHISYYHTTLDTLALMEDDMVIEFQNVIKDCVENRRLFRDVFSENTVKNFIHERIIKPLSHEASLYRRPPDRRAPYNSTPMQRAAMPTTKQHPPNNDITPSLISEDQSLKPEKRWHQPTNSVGEKTDSPADDKAQRQTAESSKFSAANERSMSVYCLQIALFPAEIAN